MDKKRSVWIIEDDQVLLKVLESAIKMNFADDGVVIHVTADGGQAIADLEHMEVPDLIILDLMLPHASGFKVLETIRGSDTWQGVEVIVLSNLSQSDDIARAESLGVKHYLVKANVRIEDVVKMVSDALSQ